MKKDELTSTWAYIGKWIKKISQRIFDWIHDEIVRIIGKLVEWFVDWGVHILIGILCLALPAGCIFGICKSVDRQNQEIAIMDDSLGMRRLDPDQPDLKFYPVKIDGHDCWKYYSEGTHYIHFAKDCSICCKEIDNDTILIISGQ